MAALPALSELSVVPTPPISTAVAALTPFPAAMENAQCLGEDPRPLAIIVTLSVSLCFGAALDPALLLADGPDPYRLIDSVRTGVPLTVLPVLIGSVRFR